MKIFITGRDGLVGHALAEHILNIPHHTHTFQFIGREDADLTKEDEVRNLFDANRPDYVIHAAARVGGIGRNATQPATMFTDNILINTNVIKFAQLFGVKKLLALSSVCVFCDGLEVLRECDMHKNEPFQAEYAYGFSKRAIDIHINGLQQEYGIENYASLILTNLFGKCDNYNLQNGHVIPSLIHKVFLAKQNKQPLHVWGTGNASREFLYVHDLAKITFEILELDHIPSRILISRNELITIKNLVQLLCKVAEFDGDVIWETDKPEGQTTRRVDLSVLNSIVDVNYTDMEKALHESYSWFETNYEKARK